MTDEQWAKIQPFAEAAERARLAFEMAKAQNTSIDLRERIEQGLRYRRLEAEAAKVAAELNRVTRNVVDGTPMWERIPGRCYVQSGCCGKRDCPRRHPDDLGRWSI